MHLDATEPDGRGGWYVQWTDPANLDGQPLTAFIHVTPDTIAELIAARRLVGAPCEWLEAAHAHACEDRATAEQSLEAPEGPSTTMLEWMTGYEEHLADLKDRWHYRIRGEAPHSALEAARAGLTPAAEHLVTESGLDSFVGERLSQ